MKIAWFTPFWRASAIGTFSRHVAERLALVADVELWVPELEGAQETALEVVEFDPTRLDTRRLGSADVVVYNLGNNLAFHHSIMLAARKVPGVVILHDLVMHHVYLDEVRTRTGAVDEFVRLVRRWYGDEAGQEVADALSVDPMRGYPPDHLCARLPLIEQATVDARGLIVHSNAQEQRLRDWWVGPFARLQLPSYDAEVAFEPSLSPTPHPDGRLRLVSVGWIGRAKQVHQVLEALGRRPGLRDRVHYRVAGLFDESSDYGLELLALIEHHGLHDCVELLGFLTDDELEAEMAQADVFVNLRWPSTEGGSAALVQQLISGRPVIVSRTGIFDEMPEHAVVKVAPDDAEAVADAIQQLVDRPDDRTTIGRAGHEVARQFTVEAYARGVEGVLTSVAEWGPVLAVLDRIGDRLEGIGARPGMPFLQTVGAELSQLFGPRFSQGRSMRLEPQPEASGATDRSD